MDTHERPASRRQRWFAATVLVALPLSAQQTPAAPPKDAPDPALTAGLPTFLLPVPGGEVTIGLTFEQLLELTSQAVNPHRPEGALKEQQFAKKLGNVVSELGQERRHVDTFLLGKWCVTNKEYESFFKQMAANGTKIRPPYHWWRYGRKDDYDAKLEDINNQFKADGAMGPVKYWERYGLELPYALKDEKGKPIDRQPVVYVSYRDAVRCAGWFGMRLPTELERTRAARGDGKHVWPWGADQKLGDKYVGEAVLEQLRLLRPADKRLKDVGEVAFLSGPFGHFDMAGQVWEFTSVRGLDPLCGTRAFEAEWKRAQKDKVGGQIFTDAPGWKDKEYIIVKGGSYLSSQDPIQLHLDSRFALLTDDVVQSAGFRFAKSLKPGYDLLVSLVSSDYNMDLFETGKEDQAVAFEAQIGLERYVLDKEGFPLEYHAVSFAPVNWLTSDKSQSVQKLEEKSQHTPVLIGTMATTEPLLQPKLDKGLYSVAYRQAGMPKDLKDAIKAGYKEVQRSLKQAESGAEPASAESNGEEKSKKGDWRSVLARFGLTEKDLEAKGADTKLELIRLGTYEVPTDQDLLLFFDNSGKWVAHVPGKLAAGNLGPAELAVGSAKVDKAEHMKLEFKVRVPLLKDQKKGAEYKVELLLEQGPPAAGVTWRMPVETGNGAAGGTNNKRNANAAPPAPAAPQPATQPPATQPAGAEDKPKGK